MKKTFFLAGFATMLFACNNTTVDHAVSDDTLHHSNDHQNNSNSQSQMNPVTATMDKMMHEMHSTKPTGNNDVDFAAMMLAHHKGAVEMSKVELEKGNNTDLQAFAQKVIDAQSAEIKFMQDFIAKAGKTKSANAEAFQKTLSNSMMAMMTGNTIIYQDVDKDFAAQMIPHHQSAIDMAKGYVEFGSEKSLTTLSQNIISSQAKEIDWLKEWLGKNSK